MGLECPFCHTHQPYTNAITATGEPAKKNREIIARKLGCGHVVGSTAYMEYREKVAALEADTANAIRAAEEKLSDKKLALWTMILKPTEEA